MPPALAIWPRFQVVWRFSRLLAMAARADAYTARALAVDDPVAYDLASKGADARRHDVKEELRLLRVRRPLGGEACSYWRRCTA